MDGVWVRERVWMRWRARYFGLLIYDLVLDYGFIFGGWSSGVSGAWGKSSGWDLTTDEDGIL
jgi:hypothetical protein